MRNSYSRGRRKWRRTMTTDRLDRKRRDPSFWFVHLAPPLRGSVSGPDALPSSLVEVTRRSHGEKQAEAARWGYSTARRIAPVM